MLGCRSSGYYDWKVRPPSARTLRHAWLAGEIAQVHKDSGGTYGTLRVTAELRYGRGIHVGKDQVQLLMRRLGIYGLPKRRLPERREGRQAQLAGSRAPPFQSRRARPAVDDRHHRAPDPGGQDLLLRGHRRVLPHGRRLVDRQQPDRAAGHQRARDGARTAEHRERAESSIPIRACNSRPGSSARRSQKPASRPPWVPSALRSIMRWSRRSGRGCRSSCSTANAGRPASSSPARSTTTSRSGTTPDDATAP